MVAWLLACSLRSADSAPRTADADVDADADADADADGDTDADDDVDVTPPGPGFVTIVSGTDLLAGKAGLIVEGFDGVLCGSQLFGPGDLDGDGDRDVIVGCFDPKDFSSQNFSLQAVDGAHLSSGKIDAVGTVNKTDAAYQDLWSAADVDGDGRPEVGIVERTGTSYTWGRVIRSEAWNAGKTVDVEAATWSVAGPEDGVSFFAPTFVDERDGDGRRDVVLTLDSSTGGSRVALLSSSSLESESHVTASWLASTSSPPDMGAVSWFGSAGDLDGDEKQEVAVAFRPSDPNTDEKVYGDVRVLFGSAFGTPIDDAPSLTGIALGVLRETHVATLGDLDGDGHDELAVWFVKSGSAGIFTEVGIIPGEDVPAKGVLSIAGHARLGVRGMSCDVDGDGLLDWVSSSGTWTKGTILDAKAKPNAPGSAADVCLGDLDGDGASEVGFTYHW